MPNYSPSDAEKTALQFRRPGGDWQPLTLEGVFKDAWSLLPATMEDATRLPNRKRDTNGTLVLSPCPDGGGVSETAASKTKGTSTLEPNKRLYRAPKGGSLTISKVTASLTDALKSRIVKRLGYDEDSAASAKYIPLFEGGEEMEVRVVPDWRLALRNTLTVDVDVPGEAPVGWTNYPWRPRTALVAGHSQALGCWPAYNTQGQSAFELTLAKKKCKAIDPQFLNDLQDKDTWNWEAEELAQAETTAVSIDVPCIREGLDVTAKLIFRTSVARFSDADPESLPFLRP